MREGRDPSPRPSPRKRGEGDEFRRRPCFAGSRVLFPRPACGERVAGGRVRGGGAPETSWLRRPVDSRRPPGGDPANSPDLAREPCAHRGLSARYACRTPIDAGRSAAPFPDPDAVDRSEQFPDQCTIASPRSLRIRSDRCEGLRIVARYTSRVFRAVCSHPSSSTRLRPLARSSARSSSSRAIRSIAPASADDESPSG